MRTFNLPMICIFLLFSIAAQAKAAPQQAAKPSDGQIAKWVKQLDSDDYSQREFANTKLIETGAAALEPVSQAAANGGPEVVWRAVTILEKIGATGTEKTLLTVIKSLKDLGAKGDKRAARISATLQHTWQMTRHKRAVVALRKMGAEITEGQAVSHFPGGSYPSIPVYPYPGGGSIPYFVPDVSTSVESFGSLRTIKMKTVDPDSKDEIIPVLESDFFDEIPAEAESTEPCDSEPPEEEVQQAEQPDEVQTEEYEFDEVSPRIIVSEEEELILETTEGTLAEDADFFVSPRMSGYVGPSPFGGPTAPIQSNSIKIGEKWKGGDEGLKYLRDLLGFTSITIEKNKLTAATLKQVAAMPLLAVLTLQYCDYEQSVIAEFREAHPKVQVRAFGATVLGVAGNPDVTPFVLSHVQPKTAAAKAGLQVGDTIVSVDGEKLKDFSQLTFLVASKKIGDELTLEILRDGKTMVRKAELGARAEVKTTQPVAPTTPVYPSYPIPTPFEAPSPR